MNKIKMLVLSLTGKCNFSCVYCYAVHHNEQIMTAETAIKAIDLARESGEKFVLQFSGGEPLLNFPVIQASVEYVEQNHIPAIMQIQTNASLLTEEIATFLYHHKIGIGISLDGTPHINDQLRLLKNGKGATTTIARGVGVLKKLGIAAGLTCVVTKVNVKELAGIINMAYYLGNIRKIGFDLLRGQGRGEKLMAPDEAEVEKAMQETYTLAKQLSKLTGVSLKFAQIERVQTLKKDNATCFGHCYAMNGEAAFIDAVGNIYACSSLIGNPKFYLGHVDTGLDSKKQKIVAELIKESMAFCFACPDFKLCGGGCFARWYGSGEKMAYQAECALKRTSIDWAN